MQMKKHFATRQNKRLKCLIGNGIIIFIKKGSVAFSEGLSTIVVSQIVKSFQIGSEEEREEERNV